MSELKVVPDFTKIVTGELYQDAYPTQGEFQVEITRGTDNRFVVTVEDSSGRVVGRQPVSETEAFGVIEMAQTNHELDSYTDLTFPRGFGRTIEWTLQTDITVLVRLDVNQIDEIAQWFEYATGRQTWDWELGHEWEY